MSSIRVYIDGSCLGNGYEDARAGYGVHFPDNPEWNEFGPLRGMPQTNNNAEIKAATRALQITFQKGYRHITLYSDSHFVINAMRKWIKDWKRNGWITNRNEPVRNKKAFLELDRAINRMDSAEFEHVRAHDGDSDNEEADRLARKGAAMRH